MESNPGVFPKATRIRNEVGGSFYTVKGILSTLKAKILGTAQPGNDQNPNLPTPEANSSLSGLEQNSLSDTGILLEIDVNNYSRERNLGYAPDTAAEESSSTLVTGTTDLDVTAMRISSSSTELRSESIVQSKLGFNFHATENNTSMNLTPILSSKDLEGTDQVDTVSASLKLASEMNVVEGKGAISTKQENSSWNLLLDTLDVDKSPDGKGDNLEQKVKSRNSFSISTLPGNSRKLGVLADMFRHKSYDETAAENKNQQLQSDMVRSGVLDSAKDRVPPYGKLSTYYMSSPSESPRKSQGLFGPNRLAFSGSCSPEDEKAIQSESVGSGAQLSTGNSNIGLEDAGMAKDQALEGNAIQKSSRLIKNILDHIDESKEKEAAKSFEIKDLIGCIKQIPPPPSVTGSSKNPSCTTDESRRGIFVPKTKPFSNLKKERKTSSFNFVCTDSEVDGPSNVSPANSKTQDDETTGSEYVAPSSIKPKTSAQPSLSTKETNDVQNKTITTNKVIVKFLHRAAKESDIHDAFQDCGDISKVEFPFVEGAFFQLANVYFKTRQGLRNALQKSDILIASEPATVEAVGFDNGISNKISIPSLIGDPNFPAALGKNPVQTVMIKPLTHDISPCHIESALSFCGGKVTGFFLGLSNSVAYVELETEEAKERALAKHCINVLGKKVLISRIDIPRTTVVRISHPNPRKADVIKLCQSIGKVRFAKCRAMGILDVHYRLAEWPNMLKILNRLNGARVDGHALVAQPATLVPPEILSLMWAQPDGRKQVASMIRSLLQKVDGNIVQSSEIPDLIQNFYEFER